MSPRSNQKIVSRSSLNLASVTKNDKGAPHGMCSTHKEQVNADMHFSSNLIMNVGYNRNLVETQLPIVGLRRRYAYGIWEKGAAVRISMENLSRKDAFFSGKLFGRERI
jgi:hypothetical protein